MLSLISRETKEARIFCVLKNRTKNNLLSIVKNDVTTAVEEEKLTPNESVKARIFSDCYCSYQIEDFRNLGFILKRVNHSMWFGYGLFHINIVESLWSKIKTYSGYFIGIS